MTREIESFALADGKDRWGACVAVAYETELKVYQVPILFVLPISWQTPAARPCMLSNS